MTRLIKSRNFPLPRVLRRFYESLLDGSNKDNRDFLKLTIDEQDSAVGAVVVLGDAAGLPGLAGGGARHGAAVAAAAAAAEAEAPLEAQAGAAHRGWSCRARRPSPQPLRMALCLRAPLKSPNWQCPVAAVGQFSSPNLKRRNENG